MNAPALRGSLLLALLAVSCVGSGCYGYRTADLEQLEPGTQVRTRLSTEQVERLRDHVPVSGRVVEGRFVGRTGDRILLEVPVMNEVRGDRLESIHQRVDIPTPAIIELEVKELDRFRTIVLAGAGVAVVAAAILPRLSGGGGSGGGDGNPAPEDPFVFRFLIPVGH